MLNTATLPQHSLLLHLEETVGAEQLTTQSTCDGIVTLWLKSSLLASVLEQARAESYDLLFDLYGVDERLRNNTENLPLSDFTVVYHLSSLALGCDIRFKVAVAASQCSVPSICQQWPNANWYEREVWDLFGIKFEGHPHLTRILLPPDYHGHPLRKEFPCRATEKNPYCPTPQEQEKLQQDLKFSPASWGMKQQGKDHDYMFLNLGPNHPSVHGVFRIALQLDGEHIIDAVPDIGYHHRGAEKIAERQSWHGFIPYTDRIDYLGGVMNNLPYVMALEQLAGIEVSERVKCIRVMLSECFRILSHMLFFGTFAQDLGQLSPIFYLFVDREKLFAIIEAITGARMHPSWFRIGGLAQDLPQGWDKMMQEFVNYFPARLDHYQSMVMDNSIVKARSVGIGAYDTAQAIEWGVTGPGLRATGSDFDLRKSKPYSGYENYDFAVISSNNGDCYDRCAVRVEEMRQSLKIIKQCIDFMPQGSYKCEHPLTTPPNKLHSKQDIETLIQHFLNVSWGGVMPVGETTFAVEATKGINSYTLISDGASTSYRTRIRTPSFAHLQMIPQLARGVMVADLIAIIASIDFVMADVDR